MQRFKFVFTLLVALPLFSQTYATEVNKPALCAAAVHQINQAMQVNQEDTASLPNICTELAELMPRLGPVNELVISEDNRYVVFSHNGKELWLYSRLQKAVRLLEVASAQDLGRAFSPQWSADSRWLLFTSFNRDTVRPRIFSVDNKRQYTLPVQAGDYSTIAWNGEGLAIGLSDFVGDPIQLASFKTLGIKLTAEEGYKDAIANRDAVFKNAIEP